MSTWQELYTCDKVGQNWKDKFKDLYFAQILQGEESATPTARTYSRRQRQTEIAASKVNRLNVVLNKLNTKITKLTDRRDQIASRHGINVTKNNNITPSAPASNISALINCNPAVVGVAVVNSQVLFSNSANNFPLETRWDGKNDLESGGNIVYQDWLLKNFTERMNLCTENSAFKDTDWEFCVQLSAPYTAKVQPDTYGKIVEAPTFGTSSKYGCTMLWLRNKNTGKLARLIADETKWLSCSYWGDAFDCARLCPYGAADNLYAGDDLWGAVRRLSESRVKELNTR